MPDRLTREEIERMEELQWKAAASPDAHDAFDALAWSFVPKAIEELRRREWVSVEEGLPEVEERVLFYHKCGSRFVGHYGDRVRPGHDCWYTDDDHFSKDEITHWMPLPAPPC